MGETPIRSLFQLCILVCCLFCIIIPARFFSFLISSVFFLSQFCLLFVVVSFFHLPFGEFSVMLIVEHILFYVISIFALTNSSESLEPQTRGKTDDIKSKKSLENQEEFSFLNACILIKRTKYRLKTITPEGI